MTIVSTTSPYTIALDQLDRDSLPLAGGKGANLGAMLKAGLPVPPGFCITAQAYRAVVQPISAEILARTSNLDVEDTEALEAVSKTLRRAIEAQPLPLDILDSIRSAYTTLGDDVLPVAVRSSATAEDLPDASFAGQQDTLLNVRGVDALLVAVRRCWSSLWTPRAIAYRQRNAFDHNAVALAVVVQQMVDAEVAGVLFTADPVSGHRKRMVVNGSWGLGEAIVSGIVSPDGWVLDRDGKVIDQEIGQKERMVVYAGDGGTVEQAVPEQMRDHASLNPDDLRCLAALGRAAEQHFGTPQDIEWALRDGRLYLVQSRPITTLFPLPSPRPADNHLHAYVSFNALQGIIEPLTPMGMDIFHEIGRLFQAATGLPIFPAVDTPRMTIAASRLYLDITAALRNLIGRRLIQVPFRLVDPTTAYAFPQLLADARLAPHPLNRARAAQAIGRLLWRSRRLLLRFVKSFIWPEAARRDADQVVRSRMARLEGLVGRPGTVLERRIMVRTLLLAGGYTIITTFPPRFGPGMLASYLAEVLARRWNLPLDKVVAIRQGLPGNPTTEMDLALWHLSQIIKADPAARARFAAGSNQELADSYRAGQLPGVAQHGLLDFLQCYGHRGVREIDVGMPRWTETPEYIINTIRNYLLLDDPELAPDRRFAALAEAAEVARADLVRLARAQPAGVLKALIMRVLTRRMRQLMGAREAPKFWAVRMFALIRQMLQGAGDDLAQQGLIERPDDIFFLRLGELEQTGDQVAPSLAERAATRRSEYTRELARQQLPRIITSEGEIIVGRRPQDDPNQLEGVGVSPGVREARVRVIRDPHGARLEPGEILVAPSTDPAWTPLFLTAGGLVMEAGGMLSHGSVVAREYGIPAVVGVAEATSRLQTGQIVRIDGTLGSVERVLEEPAASA